MDVANYSNLLKDIVKGAIIAHENEKETLFLSYHIKAKSNKTLKLNDCIEILQCFKRIELFALLNHNYKEMNATPQVDIGYQKDKEIQALKQQIEQLKSSNEFHQKFPPLKKKPMFIESNLFKAVSKGKFDNVQYLIENQGVDINQKKHNSNTTLHVAC